ncbi:hypothetical protein CDAR_232341 [Caerostris darwini]|uniref:Uncharacterized protein n=1 Tax=Caerostris darwini TaxID=1538125 RepID=A0AAV4W842_9ARAC|nr:hypothetical protein CDAR_232341 [Caerostris darwini]
MTNVPEVSCVLPSPRRLIIGGKVTRVPNLSNVNLATGPSCRRGIINDATSRICADKSSEPLIGYLVNCISRHRDFGSRKILPPFGGRRCRYFVELNTVCR